MKKIDIYIEECVRHLPKKTKEDVRKELKGEISEMVQANLNETISEEDSIKIVLEELGDPKSLADRYLNKKQYLIGPQYYPTYVKVLKIVMIAVFVGLLSANLIDFIFNSVDLSDIINAFVGIFNAELQVLAWITVIFMLVERSESDTHESVEKDEKWTISELPKDIPTQKSSWIEGLFGSVFAMLGVVFINFRIENVGVYVFSNNQAVDVVPLFNEATISQWLPWMNAMLAVIIVGNLLKVASIKFSKKKEGLIILLQLISVIIFIWTIVNFEIFNPIIAQEIAVNNQALGNMVDGLTSSIIWVIVLINIAEILYKSYKLLKV